MNHFYHCWCSSWKWRSIPPYSISKHFYPLNFAPPYLFANHHHQHQQQGHPPHHLQLFANHQLEARGSRFQFFCLLQNNLCGIICNISYFETFKIIIIICQEAAESIRLLSKGEAAHNGNEKRGFCFTEKRILAFSTIPPTKFLFISHFQKWWWWVTHS